jgi:hypothetical protein
VLLFRCRVADLVSRYRVLQRERENPQLSASVHAARSIVCVPHVASCLRDGFALSIKWATCSRTFAKRRCLSALLDGRGGAS